MAVYRSDQAQFTFAAEAGDGGSPEIASGAAYTATSTLSRTVYAGDKSIGVADNGSTKFDKAAANKRFIAIGTDSHLDTTIPSDSEVRRIVFVDGLELHLDSPLGFPHASGDGVRTITESGTTTDAIVDKLKGVGAGASAGGTVVQSDKLITWVPGVYDTIDTPDPQEAMEARYMLGQNTNRNAFQIYKGQQTFSGSVAGMVLLNGMPLRFPLGRVATVPATGFAAFPNAMTVGAAEKGSTRIKILNGTANSCVNGTILRIGVPAGASDAEIRASKTELRKVVDGGSASVANNSILKLNYPLFNTHAAGAVIQKVTHAAGVVYTHHIFEDVNLSTVSWNVNIKDEAGENAFQRRYFGGLIGGMTISAEEGGLLTCGWDTATFLGMAHSVQNSSRSNVPMQRFAPMHDIAKTDIGTPSNAVDNSTANALPGTEPYYFSEGNVKMWGQTIARVRNFSINVTNGEEVRYYVRRADPDNRGPFEVRPGQRGYTMTATIGLPNTGTATGAANNFSHATSMSLWKELLQAGDYTAASSSSATGHAGFNIELQFTRGTNDTLTIRIPNDYDGSSEGTGATTANQGAFIQTAPVPIDGAVPLEQSANIIFRNMKIEIADNEPFYP